MVFLCFFNSFIIEYRMCRDIMQHKTACSNHASFANLHPPRITE